jgi:hypothetical protein
MGPQRYDTIVVNHDVFFVGMKRSASVWLALAIIVVASVFALIRYARSGAVPAVAHTHPYKIAPADLFGRSHP